MSDRTHEGRILSQQRKEVETKKPYEWTQNPLTKSELKLSTHTGTFLRKKHQRKPISNAKERRVQISSHKIRYREEKKTTKYENTIQYHSLIARVGTTFMGAMSSLYLSGIYCLLCVAVNWELGTALRQKVQALPSAWNKEITKGRKPWEGDDKIKRCILVL
jgi:hypothetical protein